MRVLIATDHTFISDGGVTHDDFCFDRRFFDDYRAVFEDVMVICRMRERRPADGELQRSDGDGVRFVGVPNVHGPNWALRPGAIAGGAVREAVQGADCVVVRVPSQLGRLVCEEAVRQRKPVMSEVIADPLTAWPSIRDTLVYRMFGKLECRRQKRILAASNVASYVSRVELPERYPAARAVATDHISSIRLPDDWLAPSRSYATRPTPLRIVHVGSLSRRKRPVDILEAAIRLTQDHGIPSVAVFAGDGPERPRLEAHAKAAGCEGQLEALGQVSSRARMLEVLDSGHVYVCASASEGLPRGALEGMSRGLPLVGSQLPGLEELLPREELVAIGDVGGFVQRIRSLVATPESYAAASRRSHEVVQQYLQTVLSAKRRRLYGLLRGMSGGVGR